jgi:hypothetical protein
MKHNPNYIVPRAISCQSVKSDERSFYHPTKPAPPAVGIIRQVQIGARAGQPVLRGSKLCMIHLALDISGGGREHPEEKHDLC